MTRLSHFSFEEPFILHFIPYLRRESVLDCGCGLGVWGYLIRSKRRGTESYLVGVDVHKPYIEFCKRFRVYDDLVLADIRHLPFIDYAFELVLACEVIEHLHRSDGYKFLGELDRVYRSQILLSTPNGHWQQLALNNVEFEVHRSNWSASDFRRRGYKVRGVGLRGMKSGRTSRYLWAFLTLFFTPISWTTPETGEFLIAIKRTAQD